MPDPSAHMDLWLPFMERQLAVGPDTVVVGHSSGAVAAMRYAEAHRVAGLVLVAAYTRDMGVQTERESGYFDAPWDWPSVRTNAGFIIQLGSRDDYLVPFAEQQAAADALNSTFYAYEKKGHFLYHDQPEIGDLLEAKLRQLRKIK